MNYREGSVDKKITDAAYRAGVLVGFFLGLFAALIWALLRAFI